MSVPLDSLVGEVHLIEGTRQSNTPATGVFTAPRRAARGREDDMLYVLIDLLGDVSSADLHSVMDQATRAYWSAQGSVTAALRAALTAANQWLMDHNTHAALPERLTGGMVCAVLRGSEVYAAQAGPTSVFVRQGATIESYPVRDAEPLPAIGTTRALEMRYAHAHLQPGDTLLLADARFGAHTPLEVVSSALSQSTVDRALDNLEKLIGKGDLIALVAQAAPAEPDQKSTATAVTAAAVTRPIEPAASAAPRSESATTVTQDGPIIRVAGRPSAAATTISAPQPTAAAGAPPPRSSAQTPLASSVPPVDTPPAFVGRSREWLAALALSLRRSAGSLGKAGQLVAQRTTPEGTSVKAPTVTRNQTFIMVAIVVAIPLIVGLLVSVVYAQQSARETVQANVTSAQNEIALAAQAVTGKETREHYAAAATKARQALELEATNQEAKQLLAQAQAELDQLDNVITLAPASLWDFKTPGQRHLSGQGFSVFVIDRLANQLNRLILNSTGDKLEGNPEPILVPGVTVNGQTLGTLIDSTSLAGSGQQAGDLIIGHDKGLIEYSQSFGPQTAPFGENTLAKTVKRLRSFAGKLYTLDPSTQQIMRYEPRDNGYPTAPDPYLGAALPDLAKATDMAIDGNVYVTLSDGRLLKFTEGQPAPFDIRNLGEPLQNPTIVALDQNAQDSSVYVFDAALKRIVQFRPDGLFVRQFRADSSAFDGMQDILVDEETNRLYVINQGVLYTVQLPPLR
jgi:serine phosphatase RsbU (regulator of sigma subunit)